jgi:NADH-quinone oxidoreductase subunit A
MKKITFNLKNTFFYLKNDPFFFFENFLLIFIIFLIILVISFLLISIPYFFTGRKLKLIDKIAEYECGFEPFDNATRQPFTIHFYIIGLLFLIFDVEIALLYPWSLIFYYLNWYSYWILISFVVILLIGYGYEWKTGTLAFSPR